MTIYELKKDWSSFKAGEKFTASDYDGLYKLVNDDGKLVLAKIQPDLLTVVDGCYAWRPNEDGAYHYIDNDGTVLNEEYYINDDHTDKGRLAIGNCFKTAQEANSMCDWLKARQNIIDGGAKFANNIDVTEPRYGVWYHRFDERLGVYCRVSSSSDWLCDKGLCFDSEQMALDSIKHHKEDWLTYLGVKDGSDGNS